MKREGAMARVASSEDQLSAPDNWVAARPEPRPSRPEAIRRLLTCALVDHPGQ